TSVSSADPSTPARLRSSSIVDSDVTPSRPASGRSSPVPSSVMRKVEVGSSAAEEGVTGSVGSLITVGRAQLDTGSDGASGAAGSAEGPDVLSSGASVPASVMRNVDTGSSVELD